METNGVEHIQARHVFKKYGEIVVVDGIDFSAFSGECVGLLGPNGAGKTTTIKMILGLASVSRGEIRVFGHSVSVAPLAIRQRCGVVPQLDNLDPDFTVRENLEMYARFYRIRKDQIQERIDYLLKSVHLENRVNAKVDQLSGGLQRRLSIARALINNPDLVVMDEPTTGLDPQVRHLVWECIRDLRKEGKTILLTTHYMEEAERLCDRIYVIDNGRILAHGSPSELIADFVEPYVTEVRSGHDSLRAELHDLDCGRVENIGSIIYCYSDSMTHFVHFLKHHDIAYISRPANLEDVFLRLTGRDLRD